MRALIHSPPASRQLIVSADDFGMSPGINAGIVYAHREGILTDTGLMVNGAAFDEAVALARETPSLSVGLHLVLVQGRATSAPTSIPDLVDQEGMFGNHPIACGLRYFFQPGIRAQLDREIRAQLEKFLATGLDLSHVDGHLNIHMHPAVLPILIELSRKMGIRNMRRTRERLLPALGFDRSHLWRKALEAGAFGGLGWRGEHQMRAAAIGYPEHMFGLHQTGHVDEEYLLYMIPQLPDGLSEIYCHAGSTDEEAARWRPADYRSDAELKALTSPRVREALQNQGVELTSYRELGRDRAVGFAAADNPGRE